jgi:hypothetical protein
LNTLFRRMSDGNKKGELAVRLCIGWVVGAEGLEPPTYAV